MNATLIFKWLRDPRFAPEPEVATEGMDAPCFLPVEIVGQAHDEGAPLAGDADSISGMIGYRRQRHQGVEVAHQPLADTLGMTPQNLILPFEALLLQPGVQVIETVEARHRHQEVPPAITDCAFDTTLVGPSQQRRDLSSSRLNK